MENHAKRFYRNLKRNSFVTVISAISLIIGFTACMLIFSYTLNEFKYDKHLPNHQQLYRVASKVRMGGIDFSSAMAAPPLAKTLVQEIPEIQKATRLWQWNILSVKRETAKGELIAYNENYVTEVDSNFFDVFNFELLQGNKQNCLKAPNAIVITEATAKKYFGTEAYEQGMIMGEVLFLKIFGKYRPYEIMGICETPPKKMHFDFTILFSNKADPDSGTNHWLNNTYYTYALLNPQANIARVESKLENIVTKYVNQGYNKNFALSENADSDYWQYTLQPISDIHLKSNFERELKVNSSYRNVKIAIGIALLILIIALINYINLSTVVNFRRSKEMAIKKIAGMKSGSIFFGFISESVLFVVIAMVIALVLSLLTVDLLEPISTGISELQILKEPLTFFLIVVLILLTGIAGGMYPALKMAGAKNITLLSSKVTGIASGQRFRKVFVILQFVIAIVLIVSSIVVSRQLSFLTHKNPGFDNEHVLICDAPVFAMRNHFENFKSALTDQDGILEVSSANTVPGDGEFNFPLYLKKQRQGAHQVVIPYEAGYDFISTLGLQLLEGRDFAKNYDDTNTIILNETAVKALGLTNPVGKYIYNSEVRANTEKLTRLQIIGVVKDVHFQSYHKSIKPFAIQLKNFHNYLVVRVQPNNLKQTIDFVQKSWSNFYPESPFSYTFLDKKFEALYHKEEGMKSFILLFTGLAIFIAVIGLFALSVFVANQRVKEIGIRKVNGAKITEIIIMLNTDFVKWVVVAFVVACPLVYIAMRVWLGNFAYKTELDWWIFALAGVMALVIALFTVSYQSFKAAVKNPVESLRYE
ncbi:ABC transporter permease [uncultured Draconibacterium sp.]|uniref:ABC transporter permease n=1 Tax=uncultured Draconibacterium sp. TaxID=1573823 RepID=UPI003260C650